MREYLEIGPGPVDEDVAQVGRDSPARMLAECRAFASQLARTFPKGSFGVRSFPHDFGMYYEVVAYYDPDDEDPSEADAAFEAEANTPLKWDEQALAELSGA